MSLLMPTQFNKRKLTALTGAEIKHHANTVTASDRKAAREKRYVG